MLAQFSIQFVSDEGVENSVGITYGETLADIMNHLVDWYGEQIADVRIQPLEDVIDDLENEKLRKLLVFDNE